MARLVLQTAEGEKVVELRAVNSLGRHPSNSIQLLDKIVSKEHCIVEQRGSQFVLRDLGSLNGTYVNRDRVQGESPLRHGDEIALGSTRARFEEVAVNQPAQPGYPPPPSSAFPQPAAQTWGAPHAAPQHTGTPAHGGPTAAHAAATGHPAWQPTQGLQAVQGLPVAPVQPPYGQQAYQRPPPPPVPQPGAAGGPRRYPPPPASSRQVAGHSEHGHAPHPATRTPARGFSTAFLPQVHGTRVDTDDEARQIGAEIAAVEHEFLPFDELATNTNQLKADYERLRWSYELTRDIAKEKDTHTLLEKILKSIFRFIPAQRGVMFLQDENGEMAPRASHRNDGSTAPISVSTTILRKVVEEKKAVLSHDAAMDFAASKGKSMILNQIQSAIVAPMLHDDDILGVIWLDSKSLAQFRPKDLDLVSAVANQAAMFIEINILGKQIEDELVKRERLSRLLSPNVAERVIKGEVDVKPGGARTECTVYNSDIRGFTNMSEHTAPEEIVEMLNQYFEEMVDTIFKYEGTLDKFMGDGIMALWGAPVVHPDDAERSVECALEQFDVLKTFNAERQARNKVALGVGIGIHTGPLVAGYIGSSKALSYTVIGDVANTSARLCSSAAAGQIVVSEATFSHLGPRFVCEALPPTRVKGKDKELAVWNVVRLAPSAQVPATVSSPDRAPPSQGLPPSQGMPGAMPPPSQALPPSHVLPPPAAPPSKARPDDLPPPASSRRPGQTPSEEIA